MGLLNVRNSTPAIRGRDARFPGSSERIVDNNGDIRASNKKDLFKSIALLLEGVADGSIDMANDTDDNKPQKITSAEWKATAEAAYKEYGKSWADMGTSMAMDVELTVAREGIMRSVLARNDLEGPVARIRTKYNHVMAVVMTTPSMLRPQYVYENWITTPEFEIETNVMVPGRDIQLYGEQTLQDRYDDSLQAFIVGEDRALKTMLDVVVGTQIPLQIFTGAFAPDDLLNMQSLMISNGVTPRTVVMHINYWRYMLGNSGSFSSWFDPATKYQLIQTGQLGNMLGFNFITDGYRQPNMQVLQPGEIYMLAAPEYLGGYTDRGPIEAHPTDGYNQGLNARGWFMHETLSMSVANPWGVVKGLKSTP